MASVNNSMNADLLSIDVLNTYNLFYYKYCRNTFPHFSFKYTSLIVSMLERGVGDKREA